MYTYTGKAVVVTGAGAGIGKELTLRLAKLGATVWALDISASALAQVADEASKHGQTLMTRHCDITDLAALTKIRDEIEAAGQPLGFWINNAGIAGLGAFLEQDLAAFFQVVEVNLKGLVQGTRLALELMERQGAGRVVNMASVAGHVAAPFMSAYNAAKFGVVGFTRALQAELKVRGSPVSLLLVSPGFVDTAILARGEKLGFPDFLNFMLATPQSVADEILRAMPTRRAEIFPTLNGKIMRGMAKIMPGTSVRGSRMLMAKSWKDLLLNRHEG